MKSTEAKSNETSSKAAANQAFGESGVSLFTPYSKFTIQPKLTINQPDDIYEQEADKIANEVMTMQSPSIQTKQLQISSVQRMCAHCEEEQKSMQRKEFDGEEVTADNDLENYVGNLRSGGQTLPDDVRSFYEPRFGYDFSSVKVHMDSVAAKSAQSINALAYTNENNIVFNEGQYSSNSDSGKRLLAHELTHVVQQNSGNHRKSIAETAQTALKPINQPIIQRGLPVAVEALEVALTATIVVQEQAAISQGGLHIRREQGQRMGDPPQPKDNDYRALIFYARADAIALPNIFADFYVEWEGNNFGEMAGAHIVIDPNHPEFSTSELDAEFTPLSSLGRRDLDKRAWPMVWVYSGNFNPAGPGNWDFQGKFEINAFGGFRILEHTVTDHSLYSFGDAQDFVRKGEDISVPIPSLPPGQTVH